MRSGAAPRFTEAIKALLARPATRAALTLQAAAPSRGDAASCALAYLALNDRPDLVDALIQGGAAVGWPAVELADRNAASAGINGGGELGLGTRSMIQLDGEAYRLSDLARAYGGAAAALLLQRLAPWSPQSHPRYPPAFRAALRALLLESLRRCAEAGRAASTSCRSRPAALQAQRRSVQDEAAMLHRVFAVLAANAAPALFLA